MFLTNKIGCQGTEASAVQVKHIQHSSSNKVMLNTHSQWLMEYLLYIT